MPRKRLAPPPKKAVRDPLRKSETTVKSAARVMQIFEYFDDIQAAASVMDVADALGYPQSSTSALLRSLVQLGYLEYDPVTRAYITSPRTALLGAWRSPSFLVAGPILDKMQQLSEQTGDTILLATRNGLYAQYIHVIQAKNPARLHVTLGTVRPLPYSGAGHALLCDLSDDEIISIVTRYNAEHPEQPDKSGPRAILDIINQARTSGYAMTTGIQTPGGGIIATSIAQPEGGSSLAIGIGGIAEVLRHRERELADILLRVTGGG